MVHKEEMSVISLLQLEYFCALAKGESLTKTAQKLFISQSTLSAAITKLEKEVGIPLFDRDKGQMRLNEAGNVYLHHISAALTELEHGKSAALQTRRKSENRISLAASHSSMWLEFAQTFRENHPGVYIQFQSEDLTTYHRRLIEGTLDFVITGAEDLKYSDLCSVEINTSPLCLCVGPGSHLAQRKSITLAEIQHEPYIDLSEGLSFRNFSDKLFEKAGININRVFECESATRPSAIRNGEGVAITPSQKDIFKPYEGLTAIPITDDFAKRTISLYWKRGRKFSPIIQEFYDAVTTWLVP